MIEMKALLRASENVQRSIHEVEVLARCNQLATRGFLRTTRQMFNECRRISPKGEIVCIFVIAEPAMRKVIQPLEEITFS